LTTLGWRDDLYPTSKRRNKNYRTCRTVKNKNEEHFWGLTGVAPWCKKALLWLEQALQQNTQQTDRKQCGNKEKTPTTGEELGPS
jgi:hypothetical protein